MKSAQIRVQVLPHCSFSTTGGGQGGKVVQVQGSRHRNGPLLFLLWAAERRAWVDFARKQGSERRFVLS